MAHTIIIVLCLVLNGGFRLDVVSTRAPLGWHRKFMHISDPHVAVDRLTELMLSLLRELHDMPRKAIDPNWLESLEDEEQTS